MADPTEADMMADLAAADSAGDAPLAQHIAGKIQALRQPPDTHSLPQKIAHYGAKALPAAGGVGGAILAGVPAIPTGPGALLTGAAGVGLGAMSGRALQKAVDQYLGYEQPDLKRDLIDVGETGLRDATYATGAGVATAGLAKVAPFVASALQGGALATGRRVLTNVSNSLSRAKPLSDEAVAAAFKRGAFRFGGTSAGATERLGAAREEVGQQYAKIVADLEKQGITGPDAARLAEQYAARAQTMNAGTMNPAVPNIYESAAEQVAAKPTVGGRLGLSQTEDLKRSLQGMAKSAYKQMQPAEVGQAHEETASMMRQAMEDEIARQAPEAGGQFVPVKQELAKLIEASNAAREGMARQSRRNFFSLPDLMAGGAEMAAANPLLAGPTALASHALRARGPSTAAVLLRGASSAAGGFPAIAPQAQRAAMALAPAEADPPIQIEALIRALLKKYTSATQLADASQQ